VRLELPPPEHTPAEAREAADRILERPEYQWQDSRSLIDRIVDWLGEQFGRLASPLGVDSGGVPGWVGWLVLGLLVATVALLVYRARGGWRRERTADGPGQGRVIVAPGEEGIDWEAEAARCEAEGRWREALRARYRLLVGGLAARGVIGDLVGRTAGELVAEVRASRPEATRTFTAATDLFEEAWYGGAAVDPTDLDHFAGLADATLRAASGRAEVSA
jgi:Domain of unknown function (DUF4129)